MKTTKLEETWIYAEKPIPADGTCPVLIGYFVATGQPGGERFSIQLYGDAPTALAAAKIFAKKIAKKIHML